MTLTITNVDVAMIDDLSSLMFIYIQSVFEYIFIFSIPYQSLDIMHIGIRCAYVLPTGRVDGKLHRTTETVDLTTRCNRLRYKDKIRRMTEENSACTFLDYDCQTGFWAQMVRFFTLNWGLS